ncbi:MAG: hypothetical protein MZV70_16050 [Desulfobacterales bacterium]|nr:hypothetical protein [Desulfobacterales bacterium]
MTVVDPHRPGHEMSYYPGECDPAAGRRGGHQQDRQRRCRRHRHRAPATSLRSTPRPSSSTPHP